MRLGYQGAKGCNSHVAAIFLGKEAGIESPSYVDYETFEDALKALAEGDINYAAIPLENTLGGQVSTALDALARWSNGQYDEELQLVTELEVWLPIRHAVIAPMAATSLTDIVAVHSHPQALAQCQESINRLGWRQVNAFDTAGAIPLAVQQGAAALAPPEAAALYDDCKILCDDFSDSPGRNFTRFALLHRGRIQSFEGRKILLQLRGSWAVKGHGQGPGFLAGFLSTLSALGADCSRVENRPVPAALRQGSDGVNIFHIDFSLPIHGLSPNTVVSALSHGYDFRVYGATKTVRFQSHTPRRIAILGRGNYGRHLEEVLNAGVNPLEATRMQQPPPVGSISRDLDELRRAVGGESGDEPPIMKARSWSLGDEQELSEFIVTFDPEAVVFCVPMNQLRNALDSVATAWPAGRELPLVIDVSSVKAHQMDVWKESELNEAPYLSIHTMFGPNSGSNGWVGLRTAVCEAFNLHGRSQLAQSFLRFFDWSGCYIIWTSSADHDVLASRSQFVVHLLSSWLDKLGMEENPLATSNYEALRTLVEQTRCDSEIFGDMCEMNAINCEKVLDHLLSIVRKTKFS